MKSQIRKWLGITADLDYLNGTQFAHHMRLLELERKVAALYVKPKRDVRGRFEK